MFFKTKDGISLKKTNNMAKYDEFKTLLSSPVYRVFFQQYMQSYNDGNMYQCSYKIE